MSSCNQGSCFEETESFLKASLYTVDATGTEKLTAPDTVTIYGIGKDSVLYYKQPSITHVLLPLNSSADTTRFIIIIHNLPDTLECVYSNYPHFISKECGYTFYHHLDTAYFYHQLDTITTEHHDIYFANKTITNLNVENIRIFY
jgi:hypothetical protein